LLQFRWLQLLLVYYYYSPPWRVFRITNQEQTMFPGSLVLQLLCNALSHVERFCTSCSKCAAPSVAVLCSSLISGIPGVMFKFFPNCFEMVLVARVTTDITFVFIFYMRCISL
jgi:hypothetical protein